VHAHHRGKITGIDMVRSNYVMTSYAGLHRRYYAVHFVEIRIINVYLNEQKINVVKMKNVTVELYLNVFKWK